MFWLFPEEIHTLERQKSNIDSLLTQRKIFLILEEERPESWFFKRSTTEEFDKKRVFIDKVRVNPCLW